MENPPNFHDGYVDGVLVSERNARILIRTADDQRFTIILRDVKSLAVNDFRQGNIILSLEWLEPANIADDSILSYYSLRENEMSQLLRERWLKEISGKQLQALEICPSYGASLTAIFRGWELVTGFATSF